ncbi:MAG: hypothetical protein RMM17_01355 [Acidobacteriota bacterium]|nr:hypothetical protein [Blastocatellia bacterium]MDW8411316.1 hypothetical protein [Acidobacteriota bacterium]
MKQQPDFRPQTPEEIERELQQKLASLGISLGVAASYEQHTTQPISEEKKTAVLDIVELRSALKQQIDLAEIKREVEKILKQLLTFPEPAAHTQELELRVAGLILPYCKKYVENFPQDVLVSEFAVEMNLQDIVDFHADNSVLTEQELDELVEQYTVQIIQAILNHPLIPQKSARRIGMDLKTTALKDDRGTALYTAADAQFLGFLIDDPALVERSGEVGLLAILISGRKWNKIDSESLFRSAVLYTLEAMAKKQYIPSILIRGHTEDHPIAYILTEYISHNLGQTLEVIISFIEDFLETVRKVLNTSEETFIDFFYSLCLPKLKAIFDNNIHESFDRFVDIFRREYQSSQRSLRSKIFFFKRCADLCELSFYSYEAVRTLVKAQGGEVYAKEQLDLGTKHFALRNNIPISESSDLLTQKNSLSELLFFALKQRTLEALDIVENALISIIMTDLLFFINNLRNAFDHDYAQGRSTSNLDYNRWEEMVSECSKSYCRLFLGRSLNDIERYHFEQIYRKAVEQFLSFFELQAPTLLSTDLKLEAKIKRPEENLKEQFLKFLRSLHDSLTNFNPYKSGSPDPLEQEKSKPTTATLSLEMAQTRAFLLESDLQLSDYTLEALSSAICADTKDKAALLQALRAVSDLTQKVQSSTEINALITLLKNLLQRINLLYILNEEEKELWKRSLSTSISELEQSDPIAISSYGIVLDQIESWDISDHRIIQEWKNPETTIFRLEQLLFILLETRSIEKIRELIGEFKLWVELNAPRMGQTKRKAFEQRISFLSEFIDQGTVKLKLLRLSLKLLQYLQVSLEITDWHPNPAYVLEDLLAVETSPKRLRHIEAILLVQDPRKTADLITKFETILQERCRQSASGYSYYTEEEQELMRSRLSRFAGLQQIPGWKIKKFRLVYAVCRLLAALLKRRSN